MAERELPWAAGAERREYLVRTLRNRDAIRERLRPQREHAAYALAQLEPGLFERTRWFTAKGPGGRGLVTHSRGGLGDATFVTGNAEAIAAILTIEPGPARSYLTCLREHVDAVGGIYQLSNSQPMLRMTVNAATFRRWEVVPAVRLLGIDIRRINQLYGSDGNPTYYEAGHIDGGEYRGVVISGRLVAIAGTHAVSPQEGVAVVGKCLHSSAPPRAGLRHGRDERGHGGAAGGVRHGRADGGPEERAGDRGLPAARVPGGGGDGGGDGHTPRRARAPGAAATPAGAAAGARKRRSAGRDTLVRLDTSSREGDGSRE